MVKLNSELPLYNKNSIKRAGKTVVSGNINAIGSGAENFSFKIGRPAEPGFQLVNPKERKEVLLGLKWVERF